MIKFLVMDVDGTLTDGKIYMGPQGEALKRFDVKDGCGIKDILPRFKIVPIIITARTSESLINRCNELGIVNLYQGVRNKIQKLDCVLKENSLKDNCEYNYSNVAYIGDDILDLQCMEPIKTSGGIVGCPSNAVKEVVKISDFISKYRGGDGAVREFIEWLAENKNTSALSLNQKVDNAIACIKEMQLDEMKTGTYQNGEDYFMIQEYKTIPKDEKIFESHEKYIDIQYIIKGKEKIKIAYTQDMTLDTPYDSAKDVTWWKNERESMDCVLSSGSYVVLYPEHAHNPCIIADEESRVKKLVYKVKI